MKKRIVTQAVAVLTAVSMLSSTAFAASFADLQNAIDSNGGIELEEGRWGYGELSEETNKYGVEAWNSEDGRNVQLNEDIEDSIRNPGITIDGNKDITLDLNDHKLKQTAQNGYYDKESNTVVQPDGEYFNKPFITVKEGSELTVTDSGSHDQGLIYSAGNYPIANYGTLNVEDGHVNGSQEYGVYNAGTASVSKDAEVSGGTAGVNAGAIL